MNLDMEESLTRVVFDTNILISAFLYKGKPEQVLELALDKQITAVTSSTLLVELLEVLLKKFDYSEEKIRQIEHKIKNNFLLVYPKKQLMISRDESDNRVLEAAVEGNCQYIVTGDKDLLDLGSFRGTKIVTADEFLEIFGKN